MVSVSAKKVTQKISCLCTFNVTFCKRQISSVFWQRVPPPPPSQTRVSPPLDQRGGGQYSLSSEGVGGPDSDDWTESPSLLIYSVVDLWLRLWARRQCTRQSSWTQWTSTPSVPLPQPSPRSRLLLVQGQSENFAFNFSLKDSTLQRKSHLCIPFLGIVGP